MKTISPNVQDLLDQISEMDIHELREFRILLAKRFDMTSYMPETDEDGDNLASSRVPRNPIVPVISEVERT